MKKTIFLILTIVLFSCINQQKLAKKHLVKKDYKFIEFFDYKECICSNGDIYYIGFMAVKDSEAVEGVIWRKHKYLRKYGISLD